MTLDNRISSGRYNSARKVSKGKSPSPLLNGFIWGGTFTLTAIISAVLGATVALKSSLPVDVNPLLATIENLGKHGWRSLFIPSLQEPINIIILGIDQVPEAQVGSVEAFSGRSDTILLARFQPQDNSLRLLSIPRDSRVEMPNGSYDKVNSANALGGADFAVEVLSQNLNSVPIDRYIRVTTSAFREMVDLVGGIEVYVPYDMKYKDDTQKLYIDLKQGLQTLNGEQAEQFSRFRKDALGDIGRVQRQQILMKALRQKIQNPAMITRIPEIWELLQRNIDTNLTYDEMLSLASFSVGLDQSDLKMVMLPGRFSTTDEYNYSYWIISETATDKIMQEFFDQDSSSTDSSLNTEQSPYGIKIAIQNATSNPNLARAMAQYLQDHNFHNVYISSRSNRPILSTQIIAQQGDLKSAQMLQQVLEFGEIEASSTGDLDSDLTILLGADAEKLLQDDTFAR
jgi:LCP family protein required for cell wall assembly